MEKRSEWSPLGLDPERSGIDRILERFGDLGENWSVMNEGIPISREVIGRARQVFFQLRNIGCEGFELQPGLSGEVWLACEKGGQGIEVVLNPDDTYELYVEINEKEVTELVDLSYRELMLELIKPGKWKSLEFSTLNTTQLAFPDTLVWRSDHHPTGAAFLFSSENAPNRIVAQCASTSSDTMAA